MFGSISASAQTQRLQNKDGMSGQGVGQRQAPDDSVRQSGVDAWNRRNMTRLNTTRCGRRVFRYSQTDLQLHVGNEVIWEVYAQDKIGISFLVLRFIRYMHATYLQAPALHSAHSYWTIDCYC